MTKENRSYLGPGWRGVWLGRTIVCLGICQQNCNTLKKQLWIMLSWWGVWPLMEWDVVCFQNGETLILTRNSEEKLDGVATFQDVQSVLDWYQAQEKNLYILGGKQIFQAFEPYLDEVIVTQIHARVEGRYLFPWRVWLVPFWDSIKANPILKMRRILMILPSNTARERKSNGT